MIKSLRKIQDSSYLKFIIIIIILGFIAISVVDFSGNKNNTLNPEIVKFKYQQPIKRQDIILKNRLHSSELRSDDQSILNQLIKEKILLYIANNLSLTFSDKVVANIIKRNPYLQNQDKTFDRNKFEMVLRNLGISEQIYLNEVRSLLVQNVLGEVLGKNVYHPKTLIDAISSYYGHDKSLTIISGQIKQFIPKQTLSQKALAEYFQQHQAAFALPETRDISYLLIDKDTLTKYNSLNNSNLSSTQLCQIIEEEIDNDIKLQEIAQKLKLKTLSLKTQSIDDLHNHPLLKGLTEEIFTSSNTNLPEIFQLEQDKSILLVIDKITPSFVPSLEIVSDKVKTALNLELATAHMQKILEDIYNKSKNKQDLIRLAKQHNLKLKQEIFNLNSKLSLPDQVISLIEKTDSTGINKPIIQGDHGYLVQVDNIKPNIKLKQELKISILDRLSSSYLDDLLIHFYDLNEVKIDYNDPILFPK